nr:GNAT family N-acetyltransferase [Kribbella shirazensis]
MAVFPESYLDDIVEGRQLALGARDACDPENHGRVFGVASAASMGAGTAEFAVWVDDAWQGHGVGTLLTKALFEALGRAGIRTAIGIAEPGNPAVRRMISKAAQRYSINAHDDVLVISVPLGT